MCLYFNKLVFTYENACLPTRKNEQRKASRTNNTNYYLSWGKLKGAQLIEVENQNSKWLTVEESFSRGIALEIIESS